MQNNKTFAERLKKFRADAGLSQEKLAEMVNVSLKTFQRWEYGKRQPRLEEVKRLAQALNISEEALIKDNPPEQWTLNLKLSDDMERDFIDMTKNMPCVSNLIVNPNGAVLQLGGSWEIFSDENKFQEFVKQLIETRGSLLDMKKALKY